MSDKYGKKIVDEERKRTLEHIIAESYSVTKFIDDKELGTLDGRKMACPFHEDLSPSLFVDDKRNIWKCHSCGRGGGYVSMYQHWSNILQGKNYTYFEAMDALLRADVNLKSALRATTIFKQEKEKLDIKKLSVVGIKKRTPIRKEVKLTYMEILEELMRTANGDTEKIMNALTAIQMGRSPEAVKSASSIVAETDFDLDKMLQTYL